MNFGATWLVYHPVVQHGSGALDPKSIQNISTSEAKDLNMPLKDPLWPLMLRMAFTLCDKHPEKTAYNSPNRFDILYFKTVPGRFQKQGNLQNFSILLHDFHGVNFE